MNKKSSLNSPRFSKSAKMVFTIKRSINAANKRLPENEQIPLWTPYQLRHAAITEIVQQTGSLDIARAVAGQKSITVTQGYNHADVKIAVDQAVKRSQ